MHSNLTRWPGTETEWYDLQKVRVGGWIEQCGNDAGAEDRDNVDVIIQQADEIQNLRQRIEDLHERLALIDEKNGILVEERDKLKEREELIETKSKVWENAALKWQESYNRLLLEYEIEPDPISAIDASRLEVCVHKDGMLLLKSRPIVQSQDNCTICERNQGAYHHEDCAIKA